MSFMKTQYYFQQVRNYIGSYNRYIERYLAFVQSRILLNKTRSIPKDQGHDHHILPVSWNGPDEQSNIVRLTFKEHVIAHHLLYYTNDRSMIIAFYSMCNIAHKSEIKYNLTANQYQTLQEKAYYVKSENSKRNMSNPQIRKKISNSLKGRFTGDASQHKRAVINTDTNEVFATARLADQKYGFKQGSVSSGLHGKYDVGGYHFEYYDVFLANGSVPTPFDKKVSARFKGKKHSEQSKQKISETLKAQNRVPHNRKPVKNLSTNIVYESVTKAAELLGFKRADLLKAFYTGRKKNKTIVNFHNQQWCYVENLE